MFAELVSFFLAAVSRPGKKLFPLYPQCLCGSIKKSDYFPENHRRVSKSHGLISLVSNISYFKSLPQNFIKSMIYLIFPGNP